MFDLLARVYRKIFGPIVVCRAKALSFKRMEQLGRHASRILVLCHGNIYRSPLAELSLNQCRHSNSTDIGISISSAGFHRKTGRPADPRYVALLRDRFGLDLDGHRSSMVDQSLLDAADMVVIMDRRNWFELEALDSTALTKTVWLGAFDGRGTVEIVDPYGKDEAVVLNVVNRITTASINLFQEIARQKNQSLRG